MTKKNCKIHSFVKMLIWMAVGACFGAAIGIGTFLVEDGLKGFLQNTYDVISKNAGVLLIGLALLVLVFSIVCYAKGNHYAKLSNLTEEEEQQDFVDEKFDFWLNIGLTTSSIVLYISIAIFAFQGSIREMQSIENGMISTLGLLACTVITGMYQVIAIQQIRKKEPLKQGDAADLKFQETWLNSCDEGEKRIIFEAGYKAFNIARIVLLFAVLIALFGDMFFGGGLTAIVLLTVCNIIVSVAYCYYTMKLGKGGVKA